MAEPPRAGSADAAPEAGSRRTGRETLQAIIDGALPPPPIAATMFFRLVEVGDGVAAFEGEPDARLLNPQGIVHGGWALALIDSCTGCAGLSLLPAGASVTTIETKVNFSRPILPATGRVRAEGRVIASGRRIISAEGTLRALADGKVLAHGTSTLLVIEAGR